MLRKIALVFLVAALAMPGSALRVLAQGATGEDWAAVKCARYRKAYTDVLGRLGKQGLGEAFLEAHQRFLDGNCTARADVCPVSPEEFRMANTLVMAGMNAGMSGTFFPFSCRKKE